MDRVEKGSVDKKFQKNSPVDALFQVPTDLLILAKAHLSPIN
jgi:hypothetical protein